MSAPLISLMSSLSARTPNFLVSPAVLVTQACIPKIDKFFASLANISPEANWKTIKWLGHWGKALEVTWSREQELQDWCMAWYVEHAGEAWLASFKANFAPTSPLLEDQLANLLEDESGGLTLDWQVCRWAEAAEQQSVELLVEEEQALLQERAALMASTVAAGQVAGFLPPETLAAGISTSGPSADTAAMVEVVEVPPVETLAVAAEEESAEEDADDEDVPSTPKRSKAIGRHNQAPMVGKRVSKSTTPSKRQSQKLEKVVPQYEVSVLFHDSRMT
ncbi:hypothetical protein C0992_004500 [Termitomyces sp. T32_za158]|nr:hypothetical protein C0992_004500 [Termitomyces sp. T32_za158]